MRMFFHGKAPNNNLYDKLLCRCLPQSLRMIFRLFLATRRYQNLSDKEIGLRDKVVYTKDLGGLICQISEMILARKVRHLQIFL